MDSSQIVFTKQGKTFDSRIMPVLKCTIRKQWCHTNVWRLKFLTKIGRDMDSSGNAKCWMGQAPKNIFGPKKLIVLPLFRYWRERKIDSLDPTCFGRKSQTYRWVLTTISGYWSRVLTEVYQHVKKASTVSRCQKCWSMETKSLRQPRPYLVYTNEQNTWPNIR